MPVTAVLALGKFMKAKKRAAERVITRQADGSLKIKKRAKKSKSGKPIKEEEEEGPSEKRQEEEENERR